MANEDMINIAIRVSLIVLAAVVVIFLISYYSKNQEQPKDNSEKKGIEKFNSPALVKDETQKTVRFTSPVVTQERTIDRPATPYNANEQAAPFEPMPMDTGGVEEYIAVDYSATKQEQPFNCFPQDRTKPDDLLPKNAANTKWAQVAPAGQGDVKNQNFLTAGFLIGKDTIGVARKNPNLSWRAEPPCSKTIVSPWMNSSIEHDQYKRGFELA